MFDFSHLLQQGAAHAWLFIPSAILLGALHGLEPGHSKTMMAAFIVAVRGTVGQAILLGLAATLSHSAIVWIVALGGVWLFEGLSPEASEPYLQFASGLLILAIALWMLWRTWRDRHHGHHDHDGHHHGHHHHAMRMATTVTAAMITPRKPASRCSTTNIRTPMSANMPRISAAASPGGRLPPARSSCWASPAG